MEADGKYCFAIDRGGTFTDVYCLCPDGKEIVYKLLSEDPSNYEDAPREGIRRILEQETGVPYPSKEAINTSKIGWIRMGTTVATNALLERKGERMALVITEGFKDLLYIGNQARPKIFDLKVKMQEVLYDAVVEVKERLVLARPDCQLENDSWQQVEGITEEKLWIQTPVDEAKLTEDLRLIREQGIKSLAVVLLHSYIFAGHEQIVKKLALELGFENISLSSDIMPMMRIVPRGYTASADAYLTPHIQRYLVGFSSGFQDRLAGVNVLFMQSDGGLTPMQSFSGSRAILSGPAGGVVGYAQTTSAYLGDSTPVIGFDMGGTSTDVSRYAGQWEHIFESTTAGITVQAPQLDINTVAAGGGSRLFFRAGLFVVGPESAGAHPGPVCYRKGGPLTVTDANLCLGRLLPEFFPKIFGPGEDEPLDRDATLAAFDKLTSEVNEFLESQHLPTMKREEVALGFVRVANETMCRPIRALTQAKGYDTSRHVLSCFGGAGGQHACSIARSLGMRRVYIHRYAGVLSAYGLALADVVHEEQEPANTSYSASHFQYLDERLAALERKCEEKLRKQGFESSCIETEAYLHLRYRGTDCALMCPPDKHLQPSSLTPAHGDFVKSFLDRYLTEFGFTIPGRDILVDDIRVRGVAKTSIKTTHSILESQSETIEPVKHTTVFFENGAEETPVFLLQDLKATQRIPGPALIIDKLSTVLVDPSCLAEITSQGDVAISVDKEVKESKLGVELDAIQLSIFSHRFMSIAEQMGRVLQRTSISTNIKERLDFSCALFGPDGGLVSNAPHIPVHLGAMQEAVQFQLNNARDHGRVFLPGDVILSNHPCAGGSHLPDLTVITPVFHKNCTDPVFFVASRGHHADIGGITPGSMPPHSRTLSEEGAVFIGFLLVRNGEFQEKALIEALEAPGKVDLPGCTGTRTLQDNLSDLRAQVAANKKGISLVSELIQEYGLHVVQAYMGYIQSNAEVAVRQMLMEIAQPLPANEAGWKVLQAEDYMDDGTKIALTVSIDGKTGTAVCDFEGTGPQVWGNTNAPRAITLSALIYCLRCMVGHDVPLNQGCLAPIEVRLPPGTILSPYPDAAVVGGNVLTSQRIVDVVLKAFGACAASQGCMNNITFGDESMGYYETVAGGAGAGPGWSGRSGVHTHMTNTRITDPEVLERRYPVILKRFSLAEQTGGVGLYSGGDGVLRELLFRKPLMLSVLTERRVFAPYGLEGGQAGSKGKNWLKRKDGTLLNLGSKCAVPVKTGDVFRLQTPGGGGYGDIGTYRMCAKPQQHPELDSYIDRGSLANYKAMQESV